MYVYTCMYICRHIVVFVCICACRLWYTYEPSSTRFELYSNGYCMFMQELTTATGLFSQTAVKGHQTHRGVQRDKTHAYACVHTWIRSHHHPASSPYRCSVETDRNNNNATNRCNQCCLPCSGNPCPGSLAWDFDASFPESLWRYHTPQESATTLSRMSCRNSSWISPSAGSREDCQVGNITDCRDPTASTSLDIEHSNITADREGLARMVLVRLKITWWIVMVEKNQGPFGEKIVHKSRNSCRMNGRGRGWTGKLTQGQNLRNPRTKYKRSKNILPLGFSNHCPPHLRHV